MKDLEACPKVRYNLMYDQISIDYKVHQYSGVVCSLLFSSCSLCRVAVNQGNIIRVEEALKLAWVNPNFKVTQIQSEP